MFSASICFVMGDTAQSRMHAAGTMRPSLPATTKYWKHMKRMINHAKCFHYEALNHSTFIIICTSTEGNAPRGVPHRVQGSMRDWRVRPVRLSIPSLSFHSASSFVLSRLTHANMLCGFPVLRCTGVPLVRSERKPFRNAPNPVHAVRVVLGAKMHGCTISMLHPCTFALPAQHVRMGKTGNKHIVQRTKIGHLVRF